MVNRACVSDEHHDRGRHADLPPARRSVALGGGDGRFAGWPGHAQRAERGRAAGRQRQHRGQGLRRAGARWCAGVKTGPGLFRGQEAAGLQQGRAPAAATSGPGRLHPRGYLSRLHRRRDPTGCGRQARRAGPGRQSCRSLSMNRLVPTPPAADPYHPEPVIEARGLTRYFGGRCAVDGVSFQVPRGSVFAFLGRNGAGKTTTIRMILGLLEPTRGSSAILGFDSAALPAKARARIGYLAEGHPVYAWMRVGQYASFQRGFYEKWNQPIFDNVIEYFAISPRTKAGHLSHGQRAGLHLATTLAIEPELLILDDPATGLDPSARRSLLEAMIHFTRNRERTIFFSTHLLDDVERV